MPKGKVISIWVNRVGDCCGTCSKIIKSNPKVKIHDTNGKNFLSFLTRAKMSPAIPNGSTGPKARAYSAYGRIDLCWISNKAKALQGSILNIT